MGGGDEIRVDGVRRVEPNRRGRNIALALSGLWLLGGIAAMAHFGISGGKGSDGGAFIRLLVMGLLGGGAAAWYFHNVSRKVSKVVERLRAAADGIFVGDRKELAREEIASAVVLPSPDGSAFVRIERKGRLSRALSLAVPKLDDARAIVKAIGQGAAHATRDFSVAAPTLKHLRTRLYALWGAIPAFVVAGIVVGKTFGPSAAVGAVVLAGVLTILALLFAFFKRARVTVGADGVRIGWLWQKSFTSIDDIERAEAVEGATNAMGYYPIFVRIHRTSGAHVDMLHQLGRSTPFTSRDGKWAAYALMGAATVAERINEAVAERSATSAGASLATWESELLSRGERAIGVWVAALRGLHREVTTFREQAGGGIDALWGVLEDAAAEPERRAAAAVALSPHLDDGGRQRVRIAAQAVAAPKLRIALEAAADADDDALVEALDEVSVEAPKRVARL